MHGVEEAAEYLKSQAVRYGFGRVQLDLDRVLRLEVEERLPDVRVGVVVRPRRARAGRRVARRRYRRELAVRAVVRPVAAAVRAVRRHI